MQPLSQPGEALSRRILSPVPFGERFPAGRLKPPVGILSGDVRSLPELHSFLTPERASLPGIDFKALPRWIEAHIGDRELAERIQAIVNAPDHYVERCVKVYEVLGHRIDQARRIVKEANG